MALIRSFCRCSRQFAIHSMFRISCSRNFKKAATEHVLAYSCSSDYP